MRREHATFSRVRSAARVAIAALLVGVVSAAIGTSTAAANGVPLAKGDVLASLGDGTIAHFDSSGTLKDTLITGFTEFAGGGMCFDSAHNVYATLFFAQTLSKFDSSGNLLSDAFGSGFNSDPESCTVDASNDVFVGQADGSKEVLKLNASGEVLASFAPATESRGTDWVDLAADQCTLRYTSEGATVKAYDACTKEQLPDFAAELPAPCYAHRILSNGGELVACANSIVLLDPTGKIVKTYEPGGTELFALSLDPDRTSFWTASLFTGQIWKIDIASGTVLESFNSGGTSGATPGLAVVGEITAQPSVELAVPLPESQVGTPYTFTATVTEAGVPQKGIPVAFTVTGANAQSGAGTSNEAGEASFTYRGEHVGTDQIFASFVDKLGHKDTSNGVTKIWTASKVPPPPPPPTPPPPPGKKELPPFKLPAPVLGKTVNVEVVSGVVFVKLPPGAHLSLAGSPGAAFESLSKGVGFIPLTEARQIPVGSTLDTTGGVARLTTATAKPGAVQFGNFGGGFFTILQNRAQRGLTNLNIVNAASPRQVCATLGKKASAASKRLSKKVLGRLNSSAHGKFTTRGQYSSATVRGTIWGVTNRCDGTFTQVSRGVVTVRDFLRRKTLTLRAGQHYLAKAP